MALEKSRRAVSREYGYPWPWKVEELLREEYHRQDGDVRALARAFGCHPRTIQTWVRRFGINDEAKGD